MGGSAGPFVRLAWIASEVGSATGRFRRGNIIPQKILRPDEGRECCVGMLGWRLRTLSPSHASPCLTEYSVLPELLHSRIVATRKAFSAAQLVRHEYSLALPPPTLDAPRILLRSALPSHKTRRFNAPVPPYPPFVRPGRNLRSWGF